MSAEHKKCLAHKSHPENICCMDFFEPGNRQVFLINTQSFDGRYPHYSQDLRLSVRGKGGEIVTDEKNKGPSSVAPCFTQKSSKGSNPTLLCGLPSNWNSATSGGNSQFHYWYLKVYCILIERIPLTITIMVDNFSSVTLAKAI